MSMLARYVPLLSWLPKYNRETLTSDVMAAGIVTVMLIPQSLAYALLAGLPAEVGLYASMLPLLLYALFGSSRTLSVGPVAVLSLMTASAVAGVAAEQGVDPVQVAMTLALLSGGLLLLMGVLRLGFLANFLSHPVITGFITASGLLIALSQLGQLLGIPARGETLPELLSALWPALPRVHLPTLVLGGLTLGFLLWVRHGLQPLLRKAGVPSRQADLLTKAGPVLAVIATTLVVWALRLDQQGVAVVGALPAGLPSLVWPVFNAGLWDALLMPALLISLVGFVESVSVAQTLAAKRRERIEPNQELIGLGGANLGAALSGGLPVTGGFSRSVVNFDAGARTPAAGAFTALGIALATLLLTPLLMYLPKATLAATIIVAVLALVDLGALARTWAYSRSDFLALATTLVVTLSSGVEFGILAGVGVSLALFLYQTSRPHSALVGRVPGTEHFRNVQRFEVETDPRLAILRIDESLYFANARFLEDRLCDLVAAQPQLTDVVLMCAAVNQIDASALESLEAINARLRDGGVRLHLSEVKGPVMDQLNKSRFLQALSGESFLTTYAAWQQLRVQADSG